MLWFANLIETDQKTFRNYRPDIAPRASATRVVERSGMDTDTPVVATERAAGLVKRMTLEEKCAQLASLWRGVDADAGDMAPHQSEQTGGMSEDEAMSHGLGQLTRPFGSAPV